MTTIPKRGLETEALFRRLEAFRKDDVNWRDGRVWAYVYDPGAEAEAVIKRAYTMYLTGNALDPRRSRAECTSRTSWSRWPRRISAAMRTWWATSPVAARVQHVLIGIKYVPAGSRGRSPVRRCSGQL